MPDKLKRIFFQTETQKYYYLKKPLEKLSEGIGGKCIFGNLPSRILVF